MNALRIALGIFSGNNILYFGVQKRLRAYLNPIFMERGRDDSCAFSRENGIEINFPNKGFPRSGEAVTTGD